MDIVTSVTRQGRRYLITFNDERTLRVPYSLFQERPLVLGDAVELPEYEDWLLLREYRHALERAVAFLAIRARSQKEITQKLLAAGYLPATAEMVVYKLQTLKLLSDDDFAAQWAASRSSKLLGRGRIAMELRQKGIGKEEIEAAIEPLDDDRERETARQLAVKLSSRYVGDPKGSGLRKLCQALQRRGFSYGVAIAAAKAALVADGTEDEEE